MTTREPHPRAPWYLGVSVVVLVVLALATAGHRLPAVPGFSSAWFATLLCCDVLTAVLLIGRFRAGGSVRLVVLSGAYLWSAIVLVGLSLTAPGVLSAHALVSDPDAVWWLWTARHVVPPALIAAALAPWPARWREEGSAATRPHEVARLVGAVLGAGVALVLLAGVAPGSLPGISRVSGTTADFALRPAVAILVVVLTLAAVAVAAIGCVRRRTRGLEAWALVAAVAYVGDVVLTLTDEPRYSVAYFAARLLGLVAGAAVLVFVLRDLSALNRQTRADAARLQEQNDALLEAQRLRDHLVAVVSHEMRTPLAGLQGYLELLASDETRNSDAADRMLERSWLLTRRLTLLAEDLLAVAAVERGEFVVIPETINLAHQLDECAATFPDLDLRVSCPSDLVVHADTLRLQQVLNNLVRNAQKHGAEPITIDCSDDLDHVTIRVADSGSGVPADFVHRLFDRYSQGANRVAGGSGLGLSIVRDLVRAHGGSVRYDLTSPAFVIELPQHAEARPRGTRRVPAPIVRPSEIPAPEERPLVLEQQLQ